MNPSSRVPEVSASDAEPAWDAASWRKLAARIHLMWLMLAAGAVFLACVMSVRSGTQVIVPLVNLPLPELCAFKRTTGLDCPGCGLTRCFISTAHGEFRAAWAYHPMGIVLFTATLFQIPYRGAQLWRLRQGKDEFTWPILRWGAMLLLVVMLSQWAVRLGESFVMGAMMRP